MITVRVCPLKACLSIALSLMFLTVYGCGGGDGGGGDAGSGASFVSPLSVSLAWDPVQDPSVTGYVIHYGRSSPNSAGSCSYESSMFVSSSQGTVPNLHPESQYYFAVSSYNGMESVCSSEVSTTTPPMPTST
ncbi:MAG TPA: fibronectin type III domain-containing protein [Nitrospira sp.]|nr:fibronectin type III domain-containing protein [Nitrospira sp.]